MWILLLLMTVWAIMAFLTNHHRRSLFLITFLGTGGFQLLPTHWFWSPLLLVKPYDYAYVATGAILLLRARAVAQVVAREPMARLAIYYMAFLVLVLLASVSIFSYSAVQSVQSARLFFWPAFLLLFLVVDREQVERFVKMLFPVVVVLSLLYLLQPITGRTIINPSSEYYNPYVGSTDIKRYLSTPDFLIFFLLLAYHRLFTYHGKSMWIRLGHWLAFVVMSAVQVVSLTRSAIVGTMVALLYASKRLVHPVLLACLLVTAVVAGVVAYSTNSAVERSIDNSIKDISATLEGRFFGRDAAKDGTLSFRVAHVSERLGYVIESTARWAMGIGFIHEASSVAQHLRFRHGLPNPFTGRPIQVDTGDIAWSVIVIKTGLVGLAMMLIFLVASYKAVKSSRSEYVAMYRGALLYALVISFFSNNLISPNWMLPLMLFLALALLTRSESVVNPAGAGGSLMSSGIGVVPAAMASGTLAKR